MPSRNVGSKRLDSDDREVPAELPKREAQDRAKTGEGDDNPRSPVDAMHVDAPKQQDNARGHKQKRR
jgi:hypothetical protein